MRLQPGAVDALRAASTVNMAVVGIVFVLLLRDVDLGSLQPWVNSVLHHVMPCVVVLDWLLQAPTQRLSLRTLLGMLVFPMLYLLYVVVRGEMVGWYPYPFMNPALAGGAGGVALHAAGIALLFAALGGAVLAWGHRRQRA
jgi:FAR-17a/AIG1-like protein